MAIARGTAVTHDGSTAASFNFAVSTAGSDRVLVAIIVIADGGNVQSVTGVTYNSVAMTQVGTDAVGSTNARRSSMWILVNPTIGANSLAVTLTGGASAWTRVIAVPYTGCRQTSQPNVTAQTVANTSTSVSQAVITTVDNCALVGLGTGGSNDLTAGANTVEVANITGPDDPVFWESSPLAQTPAGSHALAYTSPGAYDLPLIVAALAPVPDATTVNANSTAGHYGLGLGLGWSV